MSHSRTMNGQDSPFLGGVPAAPAGRYNYRVDDNDWSTGEYTTADGSKVIGFGSAEADTNAAARFTRDTYLQGWNAHGTSTAPFDPHAHMTPIAGPAPAPSPHQHHQHHHSHYDAYKD